MPVKNEQGFVRVRIPKKQASQLQAIAQKNHRNSVNVEANLAVNAYIKKCHPLR